MQFFTKSFRGWMYQRISVKHISILRDDSYQTGNKGSVTMNKKKSSLYPSDVSNPSILGRSNYTQLARLRDVESIELVPDDPIRMPNKIDRGIARATDIPISHKVNTFLSRHFSKNRRGRF